MYLSNEPRNHNYLRPLDIDLTCNYSEITNWVDTIFNKSFDITIPQSIKPYKRHLKTILLELYVAWLEDPLFEIGVGMNNNDFVKYISYNKLHITKTIIDVIKVLTYQDLVGHELGYRNNTTLPNRLRIWAIPILVKYFEETRLDTFDIISISGFFEFSERLNLYWIVFE